MIHNIDTPTQTAPLIPADATYALSVSDTPYPHIATLCHAGSTVLHTRSRVLFVPKDGVLTPNCTWTPAEMYILLGTPARSRWATLESLHRSPAMRMGALNTGADIYDAAFGEDVPNPLYRLVPADMALLHRMMLSPKPSATTSPQERERAQVLLHELGMMVRAQNDAVVRATLEGMPLFSQYLPRMYGEMKPGTQAPATHDPASTPTQTQHKYNPHTILAMNAVWATATPEQKEAALRAAQLIADDVELHQLDVPLTQYGLPRRRPAYTAWPFRHMQLHDTVTIEPEDVVRARNALYAHSHRTGRKFSSRMTPHGTMLVTYLGSAQLHATQPHTPSYTPVPLRAQVSDLFSAWTAQATTTPDTADTAD